MKEQADLAGAPTETSDAVRELMRKCESGDRAACAELDRLGVEPPVIEPDAPPIESGDLDILRETQPNATWLRQQAGSLKLEAAVLEGHTERYARQFATSQPESPDEERLLRLMLKCAATEAAMTVLSERLLDLAASLEHPQGRPSGWRDGDGAPIVLLPAQRSGERAAARADARGEADNGLRTPPHGDPLALSPTADTELADPRIPDYEPPYTGDEPLGTCLVHGDYWTDDCTRCGR